MTNPAALEEVLRAMWCRGASCEQLHPRSVSGWPPVTWSVIGGRIATTPADDVKFCAEVRRLYRQQLDEVAFLDRMAAA